MVDPKGAAAAARAMLGPAPVGGRGASATVTGATGGARVRMGGKGERSSESKGDFGHLATQEEPRLQDLSSTSLGGVMVTDGTGRWYGEGLFRWEPWVMQKRQIYIDGKHTLEIARVAEERAKEDRIRKYRREWEAACPELALATYEYEEASRRNAVQM